EEDNKKKKKEEDKSHWASKGTVINETEPLWKKNPQDSSKYLNTLCRKDKIYIFIDEAHNLENWQLEIKTLIDLKYKIKFFVTGSSSSELRRGSQSPLVGRVNIEILPPFTFSDYVRYSLEKNKKDITQEILSNSSAFKTSFIKGNLNGMFSDCNNLLGYLGKNNINVNDLFNKYLVTGGFPYTLSLKSEQRNRYLRDLLSMTLSKDILSKAEIRDPQAFERLMVNICLNIASKIDFGQLAEKIGIDERSIIKYIDYYIESHWINNSPEYSFTNKQQSIKSDKKGESHVGRQGDGSEVIRGRV
ncbi:MAG: hypothetical protein HW383_757, partial [Candidatus Magasanikbacteria bacterium]|nr:hypothetical protein [Candidatus Magasanikbacteria bacterium]